MDTVSLESPTAFSLEALEDRLRTHWRAERVANDLVLHGGAGARVYLHVDAQGERAPFRVLVHYSDVAFVQSVLAVIADDPNIIVDNDFGTVLPGNEFVALCRARGDWNWRLDSWGNDETSPA